MGCGALVSSPGASAQVSVETAGSTASTACEPDTLAEDMEELEEDPSPLHSPATNKLGHYSTSGEVKNKGLLNRTPWDSSESNDIKVLSEPLGQQYQVEFRARKTFRSSGTAPLPLNANLASEDEQEAVQGPTPSSGSRQRFSMCAASLKLENMVMSDAAVELTASRLVAPAADVIAWLETDTRLDARASWRRLAVALEQAGYKCHLDGGVRGEDGQTTPALEMSNEAGSRFSALLIAVRSDLHSACSLSPDIVRHAHVGGGSAKGVMQRTITLMESTVVVLGVALSSKDDAKHEQVKQLRTHSNGTRFSLHLKAVEEDCSLQDKMTKAAISMQRHWRGYQCRLDASSMKEALSANGLKGRHRGLPRFTYVCLGDQNNRLLARDEWIDKEQLLEADGSPKMRASFRLSAQALDAVLDLLRSEAGRKELLQREVHVGNLANAFYDKTEWWKDGGGRVQMPTYKRTPYFQLYPTLVEQEDGQPRIVTTHELWRLATEKEPGLADEIAALMKAEEIGLEGADAEVLKQEFFGMKAKAPKSKQVVPAAQTYLNEDSKGDPVYLQLGWLDSVGFGRGSMSNFREQSFRTFEVVPQIRGFDHLLTLGVIDFCP
mmetsp:Transcript_74044/g.176295  ORF Transcript_74044/g.176295 Transcript_74044/m.176295 type:complete len:607 (+) Transcript_74044:103-1923(+)